MTWHVAMHALGWAALITIAGVSLATIADAIVPNWHRIWPRVCGQVIVENDGPVSSTASVLPLRTRQPQLRAVEARVQPTRKAS